MKHIIRYIAVTLAILMLSGTNIYAQFQSGFQNQNTGQQTNNQTYKQTDTVQQVFSFKKLYRGLARKEPLPIGYAFGVSMVIPGMGQYYNKDYWKIPIIWGGMGTCIGLGIHNNNLYRESVSRTIKVNRSASAWTGPGLSGQIIPDGKISATPIHGAVPEKKYKDLSTAYFIGAGLIYWAALMDVNISYEINTDKSAGKATIYSMLLPGLGQAYNQEYWKIPIYTGLTATGIYFWGFFNTQYQRFKRIHNEATTPGLSENVPISAETAVWYRDSYRRNRDLAVVGTMLVYLLNIIDANVFSYMRDFDLSDNLAMRFEPAVISPVSIDMPMQHQTVLAGQNSALGMRMSLSF